MNRELEVIIEYIKTLEDFNELLYIKLSKKRSDSFYKVYKLSYLNDKYDEIALQLELNHKKEKLSFGLWNNTSMQTVKFNKIIGT